MIKDALIYCLEISWKKRLEIFQFEQNIREIMVKYHVKDISKELTLVFLDLLFHQQNPSDYILNLLNGLLSTEIISVNIFFDTLLENPLVFKKPILVRTFLKIYKMYLPNFSGSRKRKRDEENITYYPPFPQKFLEFYISQGKLDQNFQKEAIEMIEILKGTNNLKYVQDLIDKFPKEKNFLFDYLETSKTTEFIDGYENELWISLYVLLIHYLYHSNLGDNDFYLVERLKNLKQFRSNNQTFLCELYLTLFNLSQDYISKSFMYNKLPKIINDLGLNDEMDQVFDLSKKFEKMKMVKDYYVYKSLNIQDKLQVFSMVQKNDVQGQIDMIDFILKNLDKEMMTLLSNNNELLQIIHIFGNTETLLISILDRMKTPLFFEDSFILLYHFMIYFDVKGRNKESFMKILKKLSFDHFIFQWINAYLIDGIYAQDLGNLTINEIEKNIKKNISFSQLLVELPFFIKKIYESKKYEIFEKFWKMYGVVAEISSCIELAKYSMICIPTIEYYSKYRIEKLDIDSPKNSFKIEFQNLIDKKIQNLNKFINIFKVLDTEHFIRMLVSELTLFSEETTSIQIAEAAGSLVMITGEKGSDYLLDFIKSMIQRSSNSVSFSQLYSVFINTAISLCPSQKFEEFNLFIKDQLQD